MVWKIALISLIFQLCRFAARLGWMGDLSGSGYSGLASPLIVGMAGATTMGLAVPLMLQTLFVNSPVVNESFVATRPIRLWELAWAKVTALILAFVGPVLLVEAIYLVVEGLSALDVFLGLLQLGLFMTVCALLAVAVFWLFRTKKELFFGAIALFLIYFATLLLGGLLPEIYNNGGVLAPLRTSFEERFSLVRIFGALVFGMVGAWVLLGFHWRRGTRGARVRLGGTILLAAVSMIGLWFVPFWTVSGKQETESVPMAASLIQNSIFNGRAFYTLKVDPLQKHLLDQNEEFFTVSSFSLEGGRIKNFSAPPLGFLRDQTLNWAGSEVLDSRAFKANFAEKPLCILGSDSNATNRAAELRIAADLIADEAPEIQVVLARYQVQWKKVAELPFEKGARSGGWSVVEWQGANSSKIQLSERRQYNWLRGDGAVPAKDSLRLVVVDRKRNLSFPVENLQPRKAISGLSVMQWRGFLALLNDEMSSSLISHPEDCRMLVFEASVLRKGQLTWSGSANVRPSYDNDRGLARDEENLSLPQFEAWVQSHPVPSEEASEREVARYLVALLEQTKHLKSYLPEGSPVALSLSHLVEKHFALFERARAELAVDQHESRAILIEALAAGLTEKQFRDHLPQMMAIPKVALSARAQGWFQSLGEVLARGARSGDNGMLEEAVLLPNKAGLSNEECVMLFNRKPGTYLYRTLSADPELRSLLDKEIDQALQGSTRKVTSFTNQLDLELKLALASGHPEAPDILQELLRKYVPKGEGGEDFEFVYREYFQIDKKTYQHSSWLADFLAMKPDHWVFDEKTKKYRVPAIKSEKESS